MIYIARHCQTDWNIQKKLMGTTDIALNNYGVEQAQALAEKLKNYNLTHIYSSPLIRALQTANIVGNKLSIDTTTDNRLKEFHYGNFEGKIAKEIPQNIWDDFNTSPTHFNAESYEHLYTRIKDFYNEIILNCKDNILIITHGGVLRMLICYINNMEYFSNKDYINNCINCKIPNAAIFSLDVNNSIIKDLKIE